MANVLGSLENLVKMGPDVVIQGLAGLIDGVGTGTEWSGEQVDRLGELGAAACRQYSPTASAAGEGTVGTRQSTTSSGLSR